VRTAEQPGQTVNVDLCFVPEQHITQEKLPAVSGSSGHLVIERIHPPGEEPTWPGCIFAERELDYEECMRHYAEATRDRLVHARTERSYELEEPSVWRQAMQARAERYQRKQQWKREDAAWKAAKTKWRTVCQAYQALARLERQAQQPDHHAAQQVWKTVCQQRQETLTKRKQENEAWHQHNQELQTASADCQEARTWIAILVVTDNCTRQCLGLPLFRTGSKVTSAEVTSALQAILPEELQFLISDQGAHFRNKAFAQLTENVDFVHIPVYRHRPESNGIAERFFLTLKAWLRSKAWDGADTLINLLAAFLSDYNDRPHQGLAIPGLSPNELAKRIWLM
jgi:transposase InsO family protein